MTYDVGFLMDQIAGHVTNYRNLRAVAEGDAQIRPAWHELHYHKPGGRIERSLVLLPPYYAGVLRGAWEARRALRGPLPQALMSNASVGVFFSSVFRRVPTLIDFDSTPRQIDRMAAYGVNRDAPALAALKWRLSRRMYRSAACLQAWSHWAKESAVADYGVEPEKVFVNPPGIDLEFWCPAPRPTLPAGRPRRILFVGADFRRKGGHLLLDWHGTQDPARTELHLVTREPVPPRPGVTLYADMAPNTPALRRLYHECDVFTLPSLGECFGIATVEAMGAGRPVVVSDVGGTRDIVEHGVNGYIVPAGDGRALGAALSAVLGDAGRGAEMGHQSRCIAEQRFDRDRNARRTLSCLKRLARAGGTRPC